MAIFLRNLLLFIIFLLPKIAQELVKFSKEKCEESPDIECPACGSQHIIKNGSVHNGKQKYQCKSCSRQFVNNLTKVIISIETKQLIDRLLLERISLRGIARVTQVSWSWFQNYVNQKLACIPRRVKVSGKSKGRLIIECDAM